MSPEEQAKYDKNNELEMALLGTASGGLNRVNEMMGKEFNIDDLPALMYGVNAPELATDYDMSGVQALENLPQADQQTRQRAEDAIYGRAASRLDPQYAAEEKAYATSLANKGLASGSEAFEKAMGNFRRGKNDAYSTARQDAIIGGGNEMQRDFGMGMDRFNAGLARRGQQFGEAQSRAGFGNQSKSEMFAQAMANAGMNNSSRGTSIQERLMQRQLPLNEVNALRSGNQATLPQFGLQGSQAQGYQPSQMLQAANMQYQAQQQAAAAKQAQGNMLPSMLGSLGGMFLGGPGGAMAGKALFG
jgi:hypothetical protein